jgi:chromosome segregation ATPase
MSEKQHSAQQAIEVILEALHVSERRIAELEAALGERNPDQRELQARLATLESELEALTRERDDWKFECERMNSVADDERKAAHYLRRKLRISETGPDQAGKKELNFLRGRTEELESMLKQARAAGDEHEQRLQERTQAASAALAMQAALQARAAALESRLAHTTEQLTDTTNKLTDTTEQLAHTVGQQEELEQLRGECAAAKARLSQSAAELEEHVTQLRKADENLARTDNERRRLEEQVELDSERLHDLRDQVKGLRISAAWATRRRQLIRRLVGEIRQRQRANIALKNGVDALRQNKQKAEQHQHMLLEQYHRLKASMHPRGEADTRQRTPAEAHQLVASDAVSSSGLHRRLRAQDELIESMERDIERVGAMKRELTERDKRLSEAEARIAALHKELALKQALLGTLEDDLQSAMRGRRIDTRLLTTAASDNSNTAAPPAAAEPTRTLRTVDTSRPGKQDSGTVKLRRLTEEPQQDTAPLRPTAGRSAD